MNETPVGFKSVTVFVLASNETTLLRQTIKEIQSNCSAEDIEKIVIVLKSKTCPSYFEAKKLIKESSLCKLEMYIQKSEGIVKCIAELPDLVESTHFVIMASDMEMNPGNLKDFIERAKLHPQRIICGAKWHKESTVEGYGFIHEIGSRAMNSFISILYNKKVRDPFSIFQIYPTVIYHRIKFDKPSMFPYEYTLKPMRLGLEYEEIPTVYRKRKAGKSNFNAAYILKVAIDFCLTAVRIRFTPKGNLNENRKP